ncbi:hypothetical protein PAGU2196_51190 [Pseudomonas sp. PAGU 2196]|nr:hypothetical protein PAGU2196_51190 [Pseudomonas sp. PAGU 2196]
MAQSHCEEKATSVGKAAALGNWQRLLNGLARAPGWSKGPQSGPNTLKPRVALPPGTPLP